VVGTLRHWSARGPALAVLALNALCAATVFAQETPAASPSDALIITPTTANAAEPATPCPADIRCLVIADPYLEMHSGPGRGYPVFHVATRGETLEVLKRRTDWFYVRTSRQIEGWASREQMMNTLELDGQPTSIKEPTRADYTVHRWEAGAFGGRFEGASLIAVYGSYGFTDHLLLELTLGHALGNISESGIASIGLQHIVAPEWRLSPYLSLGTGIIYSQTRATLVQPEDRVDQLGYVGAGLREYVTRNFLARFEYRRNVVFTSGNDNEEIHEWKLGFAFFF